MKTRFRSLTTTTMASSVIISLRPPVPNTNKAGTHNSKLAAHLSWTSLQRSVKSNARFSCLFSHNRKQDEARKALESALGGKKTEFEKWDKEIKRREESGGGGNSGKGGWFRRFGGSDDENFWPEAQQASLTVLGILVFYLIVAKGDVLLAVIFNPLLFSLRGTRTAFAFLTSKILNKNYPTGESFSIPQEEVAASVSAKDSVVGKWGSN